MVDDTLVDSILMRFKQEFIKSSNKESPLFNSPHEGYGVILEELDKMWDNIKGDHFNHSALECIRVGAMALKYIVSVYASESMMRHDL